MTSYVSIYFGFDPKCIPDPFSVSILAGESIMSKRVYRGCVMSVYCRETLVDLLELDILYFYMIFGMDW